MASLTTTVGTVELTIAELRELLSVPAAILPVAIVEPTVEKVEKAIAPKQDKPKVEKVNSDLHELACGHSVAVSRGRYPAMCADCKAKVAPAVETAEDGAEKATKPATRKSGGFKRNSGKREFDQAQFDQWMELHGDEPMLPKWEARIRWMIESGFKMTKRQQGIYLARLDRDPRLTNNEASALRNEIRLGHKRA